jgi:kynureninase
MPFSTAAQAIIHCDHVTAQNDISDMAALLKKVRNKSHDLFHDIYEMISSKAESLGTELKRPRSVSKQTCRYNVRAQQCCRSIFI